MQRDWAKVLEHREEITTRLLAAVPRHPLLVYRACRLLLKVSPPAWEVRRHSGLAKVLAALLPWCIEVGIVDRLPNKQKVKKFVGYPNKGKVT